MCRVRVMLPCSARCQSGSYCARSPRMDAFSPCNSAQNSSSHCTLSSRYQSTNIIDISSVSNLPLQSADDRGFDTRFYTRLVNTHGKVEIISQTTFILPSNFRCHSLNASEDRSVHNFSDYFHSFLSIIPLQNCDWLSRRRAGFMQHANGDDCGFHGSAPRIDGAVALRGRRFCCGVVSLVLEHSKTVIDLMLAQLEKYLFTTLA